MRGSVVFVALVAGIIPSLAQESVKRPAIPSPVATYAAMPIAERAAVQYDLIWAGVFRGIADGEFTDEEIVAIREFQKNNKSKQTGVLNPQEREILAAAAKKQRDAAGWRVIEDVRTDIRLGIPGKLLPQAARGNAGSRWTSAKDDAAVETFRRKQPGITLAAVFEQQKNEPPERKVESSQLRSDSFVIAGTQGLKKFYLRAYLKNDEVRGLTVLYDQALEAAMAPLLPAIWSTFAAFSPAAKETALKGQAEYGTGIVASGEGHIVTPRHVVDSCEVIIVPGLGNAELAAEDPIGNVALLRVHGNLDLVPLALAGEPPSGTDLTIVGIADPAAQRGGSAASTVRARLGAGSSDSGTRAVDLVPASGFSGAAAIDANSRFAGMVQVKAQRFAGAGPATLPPPAMLISAQTIRSFLDAHAVAPASGRCGVAEAKASVVRVICVRM
jgi:hypothetical protein